MTHTKFIESFRVGWSFCEGSRLIPWMTPDKSLIVVEAASSGITCPNLLIRFSARCGWTVVKQSLVRPDLTGYYWDDCWLCECGVKGASHTRSSAHYGGRCLECDKLGKRASYDGDTGKSGYYRTKQHRKARENANLNNAFAKHSEIYHK